MNYKSWLRTTTILKPMVFDDASVAAFYAKEEDIPAAHKALYTKKGERWELNVVIEGIDGVKSFLDLERLNAALRKERSDHKTLKDKYKPLADRTPDDILAAFERITELEAELEAAGGNDPEKINKIVEARLKAKIAPVERERDALKTQLETANGTIKGFEGEKRTRSIHDAVREAATKAKLLPEALEDALMLSERVFEVDDTGAVVVKEGAGYGIGQNAVGWMTEMQQKRPHWWAPSGGGGAGGNRGGGNGVTNPWTDAQWNMTQQGAIYEKDPVLAANLAAAAGTVVGGARPAKK